MKYKKDNMELTITQDDCVDTPRHWDNMTTMVCFHEKYDLGDLTTYKTNDYDNWDGLEEQIHKNNDIAMMIPLSLYDHSGLVISIGISLGWDSGQIGFIFITKKTMKENNLTLEDARKVIDQEIVTYNQYLSGDVWEYVLIEKVHCAHCNHTHEEELDNCGNFYGLDFEENSLYETIDLPDFNINEWEKVDE